MNLIKLIIISVVLAIAESAKDCPPGNYIVKKSGACLPCPKGSFQPRPNKYGCRLCLGSTISKTEGSTECTPCPKAKEPHRFRHRCVCKKGTVKQDGKCVQCRPGTIFVDSWNYNYCGPCGAGYYQPDAGQFDCLKCPDGTTSGYGASECVTCKGDEELNIEENTCEKCEAGYYMEYFGCAECQADTYKPKAGPGPCLPCSAGTHSDPGSTVCTPCPHGTVLLHNGKCRSCKAGWYFDEYKRKCRKCHFNEFTPKRNVRTSCYTCNGRKFALKGSTKCVRCRKNKFLHRDGTCKPCPQGSVYRRYELKCYKCGVNEYIRGGKEYCIRCPDRSYSYPGSTSCFTCKKDQAFILKKKKCATCPAGRFYDSYDAKCRLCWEGTVKTKPGIGECEYCHDGTTSNDKRTECIPID